MVITKFIGIFGISAMLITQTALPIVNAEDSTSTPRGPKPVRTEGQTANFCSLVDQVAARVSSEVASSTTRLLDARSNRGKNIDSRRDDRSTKLSDNRNKFDENRGEHYTKLRARATTDTQKATVETFITAIDAAVTARRAAVDAAIRAFRDGVDKAIADRQTAVDGYVTTFKTAVQTAVDKAKSDCAAGTDPKTVRAAFMASIETARKDLRSHRDLLTKNGDALKPLVDARRTAVNKAFSDFKEAVKNATAALKLVFKPSATSTPPTTTSTPATT